VNSIPQLERIRLNVTTADDWTEGVPYNVRDALDTLAGRSAGVTDHGALTGLGDDDHAGVYHKIGGTDVPISDGGPGGE